MLSEMILTFFALIYTIKKLGTESTVLTKSEKSGDKLVLKPIELIDLILEERLRKEMPLTEQHYEANHKLTDSQLPVEKATEAVFIASNSELGTESRKMWSRWSKWGECSTTCGAGTTVRRRLCVEGRCASGEREEQRRPCHRPPCTLAKDLMDHHT